MAERIRITDAELRGFLRDRRYWHPAHPERAAYVGWVTDGYRALHGTEEGRKAGAVWVKPYTSPIRERATAKWKTWPGIGARHAPGRRAGVARRVIPAPGTGTPSSPSAGAAAVQAARRQRAGVAAPPRAHRRNPMCCAPRGPDHRRARARARPRTSRRAPRRKTAPPAEPVSNASRKDPPNSRPTSKA